MRLPISVTIITLNEEKNIARAIKSALPYASEVIVVDSGSSDKTVEIACALGAKVHHQNWLGYGAQKNIAQGLATQDWVFSLDADEEIPVALWNEISKALPKTDSNAQGGPSGFRIPRKSFYLGKWILHGGWYPNPLIRLAKRSQAKWTLPEVHEELEVSGTVLDLSEPLLHYPFEDLREQIRTNVKYSWLGSQDLIQMGKNPSVAKMLLKPFGKFCETYFWKLGFLDGLAGLMISINAAHSVFLKYAYLVETKLNQRSKSIENPEP